MTISNEDDRLRWPLRPGAWASPHTTQDPSHCYPSWLRLEPERRGPVVNVEARVEAHLSLSYRLICGAAAQENVCVHKRTLSPVTIIKADQPCSKINRFIWAGCPGAGLGQPWGQGP